MLAKALTCLALALAMPTSLAAAQGGPAPPAPTAEVPAMGGKPAALPGPPVIGLRANEILFSRIEHAPVLTAQPKKMGSVTHALLYADQGKISTNPRVGRIGDLLVGPHHDRVTTAILDRSDAKSAKVEIAFSTLRPRDEPDPSFFTSLDPTALAKAPIAAARDETSSLAVGRDLIGRSVQLAGGKDGGRVTDLVVELGNGAIDFAVIRPPGAQMPGVSSLPRAVPWRLVQNLTAPRAEPVRVALDQAQLDHSPAFGAVAQETPQDRRIERQTGATLLAPP